MLIKKIIACRPILNFRFSSLRILTSENLTKSNKSIAQTLETLAKDVDDLKNSLVNLSQILINSQASGKNKESNSNEKLSEKISAWENIFSRYLQVAPFIVGSFIIFVWTWLHDMDEKIEKSEGKTVDGLRDLRIEFKEEQKELKALINKSLEKIEKNETRVTALEKSISHLEIKFNRLEMKIDNQGSSMNSIALCILGIATANLCGMEVYKSFFK